MDTIQDMGKRKPSSIAVPLGVELAEKFTAVCKRRKIGRVKQDIARQLIEWYVEQQPIVQAAIVSDTQEGLDAAVADALELIVTELRTPKPSRAPNSVGGLVVDSEDDKPPQTKRRAEGRDRPE